MSQAFSCHVGLAPRGLASELSSFHTLDYTSQLLKTLRRVIFRWGERGSHELKGSGVEPRTRRATRRFPLTARATEAAVRVHAQVFWGPAVLASRGSRPAVPLLTGPTVAAVHSRGNAGEIRTRSMRGNSGNPSCRTPSERTARSVLSPPREPQRFSEL